MWRKLGLFSLVLWSAACQQVLGIEELPRVVESKDATPPACALPVTATCGACMETSCCAEVTACRAEETCRRSLDCLVQCDPADAACAAKCVIRIDAKLADALSCRARSCADPCSTVCGGALGVMRPHTAESPRCAQCHATKACAQFTTCAADSNCLSYMRCPFACPLLDRSCTSLCEFAAGKQAAADAATALITEACRMDCGEGTDWSCVDQSKYAKATTVGDVPFHVVLHDPLFTSSVFQGVTVTPCFGPDCVPLGEPCKSDEASHCQGTLRITSPGPAFNGYLTAVGPGITPMLYFLHPPLTGPVAGDVSFAPTQMAVVSNESAQQAFRLVKAPGPIAERGHVLAKFTDCLRASARDVVLTVENSDENTDYIYLNGFAPVRDAQTDNSGIAYAFNVKASDTLVRVTGKVGTRVVAETDIYVRPNTFTLVLLGPR